MPHARANPSFLRPWRALALLPAYLAAWPVYAEQAPAAARPVGGAMEPLAVGNMVQLTLGLVFVLIAILATAWLLRRVGRFQSTAGGALRILGGLSMGAREKVVLIQVGDRQLLLGVAPGRVQTLHVLEQSIAGAPATAREPESFAERLGAALRK